MASAYPVTRRQAAGTSGVEIHFVGEDAVACATCSPSATRAMCEEHLDEIAKTF